MIRNKIKKLLPKSVLGAVAARFYRPRASYSGGGEDIVINEFFKSKKKGFYVDIGCFHPLVASNTYLLYARGWHGINIDADNYKIALFDRSRKRDRNICVAVSDTEGEAKFYFQTGESYGSMSSLVRSEAQKKAQRLGREIRSRTVKTMPLCDILSREGVTSVDLLTIDVEGAEELVLSTINFEAIDIDLIAVEIHGDIGHINSCPVNAILTRNGYEIVAWTPPTVFYRRASSE